MATELITAEEWQKTLVPAAPDSELEREVIRCIIRNAAQHWLEAAAKRQCYPCREGNAAYFTPGHDWPIHRMVSGPARICDAWAAQQLLREILKNPVPVGEVKS